MGYNMVITLGEIKQEMDKLKGNSPGYDDIHLHNSFLKNLPVEYYEKLREIFNKI